MPRTWLSERTPNSWRASGCLPHAICWASSKSTRFRCTSERAARSPVGRRRKARRLSTAIGRLHPTWRGSLRRQIGYSPSKIGEGDLSRTPLLEGVLHAANRRLWAAEDKADQDGCVRSSARSCTWQLATCLVG